MSAATALQNQQLEFLNPGVNQIDLDGALLRSQGFASGTRV
ncbi:hypothetical protein [Hymenobacter busanensis]|nr:hypothetical protein [Hymenobacter busanensis]